MANFIVGLTGGVASGKSEVEKRFQALGIAVADADLAAREVVAPGHPALAQVVAQFGPGVLTGDGQLDRAAMRERVFHDVAERRALEAILHPPIRALLRERCASAPGPYAVAAIPLLAEGGGRQGYPWLDRILVIDVPRATQFARLLRRPGIDAEMADAIIDSQVSREARLAIADDVLPNDGPLEALDAAVAALDAKYRRLAGV